MDLVLFQRFVKDNFESIKREIRTGVHDRQEEFRAAASDSNSGKKIKDFGSNFRLVDGAMVYYGVTFGTVYVGGRGGKYRICLPECGEQPGEGDFNSDTGIISAAINNGGRRLLYLLTEEGREEDGTVCYSYTCKGRKQTLTIKGQGQRLLSFNPNLYWSLGGVDDAKVWDAVFDFFSIIHAVSADRDSESAESDVEQTIKYIYGLPCDLYRSMSGLGHQYLRYILQSFGFNVFAGGELKKYDDLISDFKEKARDLQKSFLEDDFARLLYYLKNDRNSESHFQRHLENPRERMIHFICDQVALVYVLKNVLGLQLNVAPNNALLTPLFLPEGVNIAGDVPMADGKYLVRPFVEYAVSDEERSSEIRIKDLDVSSWRVQVSGSALVLEASSEIQAIENSIDYDKATKEVAEKSGMSVSDLFAPENMAKFREMLLDTIKTDNGDAVAKSVRDAMKPVEDRLDNLDNKVENLISEQEAKEKAEAERIEREKRRKRRSRIITWSVVGVVALILGIAAYLPFNHYARLHFKPAYYVAFNYLGQHDLAFERAEMLEKQFIKDYYDDVDAEMSREGIARRLEIAETYQQGIRRYEALVDADSVANAEKAYKLARMFWLGKGGELSRPKSMRYAKIAAAHGLHHHGFAAHTMLYNDEPDVKIKAMLYKNMADTINDPHLKLADICFRITEMRKMKKEDAMLLTDDLMMRFATLEGMSATVGDDGMINLNFESLDSDIAVDAYYVFLQLCMEGIQDSEGNYILDKDPAVGYHMLARLVIERNDLVAQLIRGNMSYSLKDYHAMYDFMRVFANGHKHGALYASNTFTRFFGNEDDFAARFPEAYAEIGKDHVVQTVEAMNQQVEAGNYDVSYEYLLQAESAMPDLINVKLMDSPLKLKLMIPDSAEAVARRLDSVPFREMKFIGATSPERQQEAVKAYRDAMFYYWGAGGYPKDTIEGRKQLARAADLGMVEAKYSFARLLVEEGDKVAASRLMDSIHSYSDRACRWLAEDTKLATPDLSRKYVAAISDTLDMYKLVRQAQDFLLLSAVESHETPDANRLYIRLKNSYFYDDPLVNPSLLAAYFSIMAKMTAASFPDLASAYLTMANNACLGGFGFGLDMDVYAAMMQAKVEHTSEGNFPSTYVGRLYYYLTRDKSQLPAFHRDRKLAELARIWPEGVNKLIEKGYVTYDELEYIRSHQLYEFYQDVDELGLARWTEIDTGDNFFIALKDLYEL